MIACLTGKLLFSDPLAMTCVIDCAGVGYSLSVTSATIGALPPADEDHDAADDARNGQKDHHHDRPKTRLRGGQRQFFGVERLGVDDVARCEVLAEAGCFGLSRRDGLGADYSGACGGAAAGRGLLSAGDAAQGCQTCGQGERERAGKDGLRDAHELLRELMVVLSCDYASCRAPAG